MIEIRGYSGIVWRITKSDKKEVKMLGLKICKKS